MAAQAARRLPATQLTPAANATDVANPVQFTWTAVPQAIGYTVYGSIDGGSILSFGSSSGVATSLSVTLTGNNVTWFVRALFQACSPIDSVVSNFSMEAPDTCDRHVAASLIAPADKAFVSSSVTFKWSEVVHANGYRVWASVDGSPFAALATVQDTTYSTTISFGAVEWYVEALFPGCPSVESLHQTFNVPAAAFCNNSAVSLISPPNGTTLHNQSVTFAWSSSPNAIGYEVYLSLASGTPTLLGSTTTATTLPHDVAAGSLEWFVRALFQDARASTRSTQPSRLHHRRSARRNIRFCFRLRRTQRALRRRSTSTGARCRV